MTFKQLYDTNNTTVEVELASLCNARCPQCQRWKSGTLVVNNDIFTEGQWSFERFKQAFPEDVLTHIKTFHFSGTYGDPMMCKDIYEICEYILESSGEKFISINTNGGTRSEDWWWEFGRLSYNFGKRINVIFDLDGLTNETHAKYRRGTDARKIMNNAEAFADSGSHTAIFTVLFEHNKHEFESIKVYCEDNDFQFTFVESNRFKKEPVFEFINEDGEVEQLLQIQQDDEENIITSDDSVRLVRDYRYKSQNKFYNIDCSWLNNKAIKITHEGNVLPCCYMEAEYSVFKQNPKVVKDRPVIEKKLFEYYNSNKFNIFHYSMSDILNNDWYLELYESWNQQDEQARVCKKFCGKCDG